MDLCVNTEVHDHLNYDRLDLAVIVGESGVSQNCWWRHLSPVARTTATRHCIRHHRQYIIFYSP